MGFRVSMVRDESVESLLQKLQVRIDAIEEQKGFVLDVKYADRHPFAIAWIHWQDQKPRLEPIKL